MLSSLLLILLFWPQTGPTYKIAVEGEGRVGFFGNLRASDGTVRYIQEPLSPLPTHLDVSADSALWLKVIWRPALTPTGQQGRGRFTVKVSYEFQGSSEHLIRATGTATVPVTIQLPARQSQATACREIDFDNNAPFKVGDEVWFGVIGTMPEMGGKGIITDIDVEIGLISVQPDGGDPRLPEIDRRMHLEIEALRNTGDLHSEWKPSPSLKALMDSLDPLCVVPTRRGQQLGFDLRRNGLKHLKGRR